MAYRPDSQEEAFDYLFKLVLIGDAGVGKTCVVQRFMGSAFVERHSSTIGVDFTMRTVVVDGKRIKVLYTAVVYDTVDIQIIDPFLSQGMLEWC